MFAQNGQEILLGTTTDGVILSLKDGRLDVSFVLAYLHELLNLAGREIGDT